MIKFIIILAYFHAPDNFRYVSICRFILNKVCLFDIMKVYRERMLYQPNTV